MNIIKMKKMGSNKKGYLSFFEANKDIPFEIKRVYYIYGVPLETERGMHAHKELQQIMWCPYGTVKILTDDGIKKESYILDSPEMGLIVGNGIWREMEWLKEESVLCVAASDYYDEADYIRNYEDFIKLVKDGYWLCK
ncbi:MAG: FdtA/QdtA family cupin domain-containing protein [Sedimentibacter sp.]